jgi:hypothetical protein
MAAGVRKLKRQDLVDGDNDVDVDINARQWVMPSLLSAARVATASWPGIAATVDCVRTARWRRVWAFDALAAPAGMTSRLIVETMQFDARASVLAIWRSGVEVTLPCGTSRYDDDVNSRSVQHRFAAALVYDGKSDDNTLTLDVCCWRVPSSTATFDTALDSPQSLLLRILQIVERALLDVSDMSAAVQRNIM